MEGSSKTEAGKALLSKQQEFLESLSFLLYNKFQEQWLPVLAHTCYLATRKATDEQKIEAIRQTLAFMDTWAQDLRTQILRDLARYVQANQSEFEGGIKEWLQKRLTELWSQQCTEEAYCEWFAAACDDTSNLEWWRAPLWLATAVNMSRDKFQLQEESEDYAGDRLDLESTDELVKREFHRREGFLPLPFLIGLGVTELNELHVAISQGARIPPGLNSNDQESLLSAIPQVSTAHAPSQPAPKVKGRRRTKAPVYEEREKNIREIIKNQPHLRGLAYCRQLDSAQIRIPHIWQIQGCPPSYVEAYKKGRPWTHYIHTEKSRLRPKSDEKSQGQSKKQTQN